MKENNDQQTPQDKDRHLDIPSEANRDKHVNFLDDESDERNNKNDNTTTERQRQWREGIEEGKKARNEE